MSIEYDMSNNEITITTEDESQTMILNEILYIDNVEYKENGENTFILRNFPRDFYVDGEDDSDEWMHAYVLHLKYSVLNQGDSEFSIFDYFGVYDYWNEVDDQPDDIEFIEESMIRAKKVHKRLNDDDDDDDFPCPNLNANPYGIDTDEEDEIHEQIRGGFEGAGEQYNYNGEEGEEIVFVIRN